MERKFTFAEDEFYHIYNRGTDKRLIFNDDDDYSYFQKLLFLCNSTERIILRDLPRSMSVYDVKRKETLVDIGCYCQMPNHFHLLLYERKEGGISKFLAKLSTAYVMYFNHKYKRTGSLFEGCFKAVYVDDDNYMQYLFAYIGLNPIKCIQSDWKEAGIKKIKEARNYLTDYSYSSYQDYIGVEREQSSIIEKANFPEYFEDQKDYHNFVDEWLTYADEFNVDGTIPEETEASTQGSPV